MAKAVETEGIIKLNFVSLFYSWKSTLVYLFHVSSTSTYALGTVFLLHLCQ